MHCFTLTQHEHIARLVLNRPDDMNTMNPVFWRELDEVLTRLHAGTEARALVISSTGKHFSAGMALETFGGEAVLDDATPQGRAAVYDVLTDMQATFTKLESLRIPVIVAIQGGCIGAARASERAASAMRPPMHSSASRRSTSAWSPTSARCSACPS